MQTVLTDQTGQIAAVAQADLRLGWKQIIKPKSLVLSGSHAYHLPMSQVSLFRLYQRVVPWTNQEMV